MRILWIVAILGWLTLATRTYADTVYLTDGRTVWGTEVRVQGDAVIVERADGALRIPKSEVTRLERAQMSIPPFYFAPGTEDSARPVDSPGAAPDRPPAGVSASQEAPRVAEQTPPMAEAPPEPPPVAPPPPPKLSGPWSPRY
jgi:hypothetical protein